MNTEINTSNTKPSMIVTVEEALEHCRESGDEYTRVYLTRLIIAAGEQVAYQINQPLPEPVPESLKQAALMLVSHWNENRETTTTENLKGIPMSFNFLCSPYRREVI